jgi:hypothetical protein
MAILYPAGDARIAERGPAVTASGLHLPQRPRQPILFTRLQKVLREHGLTAAVTTVFGGNLAIAANVTLKAFTNEAMLAGSDQELHLERDRIDKQRADDRTADADRLERIETDIRAMRDVIFEAFQRGRTD